MDQVQIEVLTISLIYIVLSNDIPLIESLCNLEELSSIKSFTLIVSPLKIAGASGSPARAIEVL
jgi:kynurenine formamidase